MTEPVYGVFLRPDAATAAAVTHITVNVERQFGFVSAGAFPPHATLAGSIPIHADPDRIVAALDPVLLGRASFPVHNAGITRRFTAVTFDVDRMLDGTKNQPLLDLATAINKALAPLSHEIDGYLVSPFASGRFHAHISLASHEMTTRADLAGEVESFIHELPNHGAPAAFPARHISLYQFSAADWAGHWWETLTWRHLHSWMLEETQP